MRIPLAFGDIASADANLARAWQLTVRQAFMTYLDRGYRVVDFFGDRAEGTGDYLLVKR